MAHRIRRPEEPQRPRLALFHSSLCEWNKSSRLARCRHAKWSCALIPAKTNFLKQLTALSFDSSLKPLQKLLTCEDQHWRRSCRFRIARSRNPISHDEERQSTRQRISDTYSAPLHFRSDGDDLGFDCNFGGTYDDVALPAGWYLIERVISPWMAEASSVTTNGKGPPRCCESVIAVRVVERGHDTSSKFSSCGEPLWDQRKKGTRNDSLASSLFPNWE
jgi:hypothetical protein